MKKFCFIFILCFLLVTKFFATSVEVGEGMNLSVIIPYPGDHAYGWSHFIIPGDNITSAVDISRLEFNVANEPTNYVLNNQVVYMRLTTASTVTEANTSNPLNSGYTQVYNNSVTWDGSGWQGIVLSTPFAYDGNSNIEVIWENRSGTSRDNFPQFYRTYANSPASAYKFSSLSYPSGSGYNLYSYPNTKVSWLFANEPDIPELVLPEDKAINIALDTSISWTTGVNTDHSVLYLADNEEFQNASVFDYASSPFSANLDENVVYYWKVHAIGSTNIEISSEVRSFKTLPDPIASYPWREKFATWPAENWSQFAGELGAQTQMNQGVRWFHKNFANNGEEDNSAYINLSLQTHNWLVTPSFDLDASSSPLELTFDLALTQFSSYNATSLTASDYLAVVISTDDGVSWSNANVLQDWTNQDDISNTGQNCRISLADYSGIVKIGFYASRAIENTTDLSLFIDNVRVREIPEFTFIEITPESYDFGDVYGGNEAVNSFIIANTGAIPASIIDINVPEDFFYGSDDFPITIAANSSIYVDVLFFPTIIKDYSGILRVVESDPNDPSQVINHDVDLIANCIPLDATSLIAPTNGAVDVDITGTLEWEVTPMSEGYKVYFSEDETFTGVIPAVVESNSYNYVGDYDTNYFWKIIPYNFVGETSENASVWSFTTVAKTFPDSDLILEGEILVRGSYPMYPYFECTVSESIYYQSELNFQNSAITHLSYLCHNHTAWTENIEIYMKHTNRESFADSNDWELENFTLVYSGDMSVTSSEEIVDIELDNPFPYNNSDNLMLLFFAKDYDHASIHDYFYSYEVDENRSIAKLGFDHDFSTDFPNSPGTGTVNSRLPVTGFNYQALPQEAELALSEDSLTFSDQIINKTSDPKRLVITNVGQENLNINSLALTGSNADQFQIIESNSCPIELACVETAEIQVVYAPTTGGNHLAQIQITDDQSRIINTVQLIGSCLDTNIYAEDIPFHHSFESETPLLGWDVEVTSTSTGARARINHSSSGCHYGSSSFEMYCPSSATTSIELISPLIVPNLDAYRLRFWSRNSISDNPNPLVIGIYDGDMTTFTEIATFSITSSFTEYTIELDEVHRANQRIAFKSGTAGDSQYLYIDDIKLEQIPTTPVAELSTSVIDFGVVAYLGMQYNEALTITNVGLDILTITDIDIIGSGADAFDYHVSSDANFALATNQTLNITVKFIPQSLEELEAILVISDDLGQRISLDSQAERASRNSNQVILRGSVLDPYIRDFPYTESFEENNLDESMDIYKWTQRSIEGFRFWEANSTQESYNRSPRTGSFNITLDRNTKCWLTRPVELEGGISYDVELYARQDGSRGASVGIYYGPEELYTSMIDITGQVDVVDGEYQRIYGSFIPPTSGIYYIGLKGEIEADPYYMSLDDFTISESPATSLEIPSNIMISNTGNEFILAWNPVEGANSYQVYVCDTPDGQYQSIVSLPETSYELNKENKMKFYKVKACSESVEVTSKFRN